MQLSISSTAPNEPGERLLRIVRAGFEVQGTTFAEWCKSHEINHAWPASVLRGRRKGPAADAIRERIIKAAGLKVAS